MVLLIAAANIANLLLAKGVARRQEMAVRAALGASRGRLAAQVLTESLVLCLLGGLAGVGLAYLLIRAAGSAAGSHAAADGVGRARSARARVSPPLAAVARFAPGRPAAVAADVVRPAVAGIESGRSRIVVSRRRAPRRSSSPRSRSRSILICGAVLMFKSLLKLQRVDAGVRIDNVITMSADLPLATYPDPERATRFIEQAAERLQAIPGVERAAVSTDVPLLGVRQGESVGGAGHRRGRRRPVQARRSALFRDARHSRARRPRLHRARPRGRAARRDRQRSAGASGWRSGSASPIRRRPSAGSFSSAARCTRTAGRAGKPEDVEIIGMIRNERVAELEAPMPEVVYVALLQAPRREIKLIVRTRERPGCRDAGHSRGRGARSIRGCRSGTCGRWSR